MHSSAGSLHLRRATKTRKCFHMIARSDGFLTCSSRGPMTKRRRLGWRAQLRLPLVANTSPKEANRGRRKAHGRDSWESAESRLENDSLPMIPGLTTPSNHELSLLRFSSGRSMKDKFHAQKPCCPHVLHTGNHFVLNPPPRLVRFIRTPRKSTEY